jgi:hypothetical protein
MGCGDLLGSLAQDFAQKQATQPHS